MFVDYIGRSECNSSSIQIACHCCDWLCMGWNTLCREILLAPSEIKPIIHALRGVVCSGSCLIIFWLQAAFRMTKSASIIFLRTPPRDKINEFPESRFFHFLVQYANSFVKNSLFFSLIVLCPVLPSLCYWKSFKGRILRRAVALLEVELLFFFRLHRLGPVLETRGHLFSDLTQMSGSRSPCLHVTLSFCLWKFPCLLFFFLYELSLFDYF